ncbi:hypothetical protein EG832_05490, partial [bacterium]|nr:hypothetical protein [bacterium]
MLRAHLGKLVDQAKANNIHHLSEMQVQSDYVLKVLDLLGWKSSDWKLGKAQSVRTGKIPDILLHDQKQQTMLIVECKDAKKQDKLDSAYGKVSFKEQLLKYCSAEGIYWGILTNFVEWRLYNEPQGRLYEDKKYAFHDLLWPGANRAAYVDLLSDEGIAFLSRLERTPLCRALGRIDANPIYTPQEVQVEAIKKKFFTLLKSWRDKLRSELYKRYGGDGQYTKDQIDLYTQKILDRMIFIEVCHDKDIISQDVHRAILNSRKNKYVGLKEWFKEMDDQFNTELFAPIAIDQFEIDDEVLVPVIEQLNGIDFEHMSVHIIGEVYENYLGEMLRGGKKQGLHTQEHKEHAKRKSQGIYYTPEYIVDYIVTHTVGVLVKNAKTEDDLKALKILDPACGSGSFLIKAFDVLYEAYDKLKGQTSAYKDLHIKKTILQHNLYGVDLDERAVEITKLNLMLKALEGFNYKDLKGRKLLPNLNLNVRCGNSLISGQTFEQKHEGELDLGFDAEPEIKGLLKLRKEFYKAVEDKDKEKLLFQIEGDEKRVNKKLNDSIKGYFTDLNEVKPLNYQVAFPEVFKQGGFHIVIGNPPYGYMIPADQKKFFEHTYEHQDYQKDLYLLFLERYKAIIRPKGLLGIIVSNTWMQSLRLRKIRQFIVTEWAWKRILVLPERVFEAIVDTHILVYENTKPANDSRATEIDIRKVGVNKASHSIRQNVLSRNGDPVNILASDRVRKLYERILGITQPLSKYCNVYNGVKPFEEGKGAPPQTKEVMKTKPFVKEGVKPGKDWSPLLRGSLINRYI